MIFIITGYDITKGVIQMLRPSRFSIWDIIGDIIETAVEIIFELID